MKSICPTLGIQIFRSHIGPPQFAASIGFASRQSELSGGAFAVAHHFLPVHQTSCQLQSCTQQVATKIKQLACREVFTQELNARFVKLVRFVKNRDAHGWQQLRHARLTHRQVSKKKMMVDDHHISRHGFAPSQIDVATAKLRALRAQAILTRRGYQWNKRRSFIQTMQFGQVTGLRRLCPLLNFGQ